MNTSSQLLQTLLGIGLEPKELPCHGSRFDAVGCVVNGPAISDLEPLEVPES
jgi:hypothetical protein